MPLLVCQTCPRYDARATGRFGPQLADALAKVAERRAEQLIAIRNVQCLGGCPQEGVVAMDAPGKTRVRFAGLDETDAEAIHAAAVAYGASATGTPGDWEIPEPLVDRLSSTTFKRCSR
ncbi:DUF1636 family protein [Cryptosporangium japonicum]|uniref:Metal-binding protein n=1 Tax=Cryptosporangium japonicum TaxID=80872 RepID=A0ABN0U2W3_9ACTN